MSEKDAIVAALCATERKAALALAEASAYAKLVALQHTSKKITDPDLSDPYSLDNPDNLFEVSFEVLCTI